MTRTMTLTLVFALMLIVVVTITCDSYNGVDWIYLLASLTGYTVLALLGTLPHRMYATCYIFTVHLLLCHSLTHSYATKSVMRIQRALQCAIVSTNILSETVLSASRTATNSVSHSFYTRAIAEYAPRYADAFVWGGILCSAFCLFLACARDRLLTRTAFAFCSFASVWIAVLTQQCLFSAWDKHMFALLSSFQ